MVWLLPVVLVSSTAESASPRTSSLLQSGDRLANRSTRAVVSVFTSEAKQERRLNGNIDLGRITRSGKNYPNYRENRGQNRLQRQVEPAAAGRCGSQSTSSQLLGTISARVSGLARCLRDMRNLVTAPGTGGCGVWIQRRIFDEKRHSICNNPIRFGLRPSFGAAATRCQPTATE